MTIPASSVLDAAATTEDCRAVTLPVGIWALLGDALTQTLDAVVGDDDDIALARHHLLQWVDHIDCADAPEPEPAMLTQICYQEVRSPGVAGGGFDNGAWRVRVLTQIIRDDTGLAALDAGAFFVPEGYWLVQAFAVAFSVDRHQCRLGYADPIYGGIIVGSNANARAASVQQSTTHLSGVLAVPEGGGWYSLQHRCSTSRATDGRGLANNFGNIEVYAQVLLTTTG